MSFNAFQKFATNRLKFGMYLFTKLPSAYLCGVRLRSLSTTDCVTSVPYKWLSQNPFKSTYFACQAMAAELSTGMLCIGHTYQASPAISMLVIKLEAAYFKKATERVYFTCSNGAEIAAAIAQSKATGQGQTVQTISTGNTADGVLISEFKITWSFKAKAK
jgi:hypothetical protein